MALTTASVASAAYDPDQLKCREKLSKNGSKLSDKALKEMVKCHKQRTAGTLPEATDCNDVGTVDSKGTILKAANKLIADANDRCSTFTPADLMYTGCPIPCDGVVPAINDFQDVADCIVCTVENQAESVSSNGQSSPPNTPLGTAETKCHNAIGKGQSKLVKTLLKERTKCQTAAERAGAMDTVSCIGADPKGKIQTAENKGRTGLDKACVGASLTAVDSCSVFSLNNLKDCVFDGARIRGRATFKSFYELAPGGGATTTTFSNSTTTTTTTTTMGGGDQDPQCPNLGELILLAGTGNPCTTNGDCLAGTCDLGIGRCVTQTELDTGWTGLAHDSDINHNVRTLGNLLCTGPAPVCGQCEVLGINPEPGYCRCLSDNRTHCDQPFANDADDCGGGLCTCYFGAPLPLSSGNTPACVVNRFANDIFGTANVDQGSGEITANLAAGVFLGISLVQPCPTCGGTCSAPATSVGEGCGQDLDCDSQQDCSSNADCTNPGGVCFTSGQPTGKCYGDGTCSNLDPTPNDGIRGGTCFGGDNDGESCDAEGESTSFPGPAGGFTSLDCFPAAASNASGTGLSISLTQRTGATALNAGVLCGFPPAVPLQCPCGVCDDDDSKACTSNAECTGLGPCQRTSGSGVPPQPNQCEDITCSDNGGGEGICAGNSVDDKFCDGIVRSNGEGYIQCTGSNADCAPSNIGLPAGNCTFEKTRECFLNPIAATGIADPESPLGVATFCIPPTSNPAINQVAGLPGPGRVKNQASATTFCASDNNVAYQPNVGGCP